MLIGFGGYSKIWKPPRKDRIIEKKFRGNEDYIQRLTNETIVEISNGQYARSIFDRKNERSSPLVAIYERPEKLFSEIRPFRDDNLANLLSTTQDESIPMFCRLMKEMKSIMKGLVVLHKKRWIHHDIKTQNVLYNAKPFRLFLIDWGTSVPFRDVYSFTYRPWFSADNSNHPPEYKMYAHYKYGHKWKEDFANEYANNRYIITLLKIQPQYMTMLNDANTKLQSLFKNKGDKFLITIAPKADVFAMGMILAQMYLFVGIRHLYSTPIHSKMIHILKGMTHPDPTKRWTMRYSVQKLTPLIYQMCQK